MVLGIQIVGVLFALVMLYITFTTLKKKELSALEYLFWFVLWVLFMFFTLLPDLLIPIRVTLHVSRTMDLLVIGGLLLLLGLSYYNYAEVKRVKKKMEFVVRSIALKGGKK